MRVRGKIAVTAALACCWAHSDAAAQTATDTMSVTATVDDACVVSANPLDLGAYDPLSGAPNDAAATIEVRCTTGTAYVLALGPGDGPAATVANRQMSDGAQTLTYSLYRDAARTLVWGETAGVDTVAGAGSGAVQTLTVYGRAPGGQNAPAGDYEDTVTVTVNY